MQVFFRQTYFENGLLVHKLNLFGQESLRFSVGSLGWTLRQRVGFKRAQSLFYYHDVIILGRRQCARAR